MNVVIGKTEKKTAAHDPVSFSCWCFLVSQCTNTLEQAEELIRQAHAMLHQTSTLVVTPDAEKDRVAVNKSTAAPSLLIAGADELDSSPHSRAADG